MFKALQCNVKKCSTSFTFLAFLKIIFLQLKETPCCLGEAYVTCSSLPCELPSLIQLNIVSHVGRVTSWLQALGTGQRARWGVPWPARRGGGYPGQLGGLIYWVYYYRDHTTSWQEGGKRSGFDIMSLLEEGGKWGGGGYCKRCRGGNVPLLLVWCNL